MRACVRVCVNVCFLRLFAAVVPAIVDIAGMEVMEGRPARLMCSVSGSPLPAVVWTHQDTGSVFEPSDKVGDRRWVDGPSPD